MKKLLLFFVAVSMLSCSSDDNKSANNTVPTLSLVGNWKLQSIVKGNGEELDLNQCDNGYKTTFRADGTVTDYYNCSDGDYSDTSHYNVVGNILTFIVPNETPDGQTVTVKATILSANSLMIKFKIFYYSTDGNVNGNTVTYIPL